MSITYMIEFTKTLFQYSFYIIYSLNKGCDLPSQNLDKDARHPSTYVTCPGVNREEVASDILLVSDRTNQQCMLLSCTQLLYYVQTMNGRQVVIDVVFRADEWFTNKLLPVACPWQIESIDLIDYQRPLKPTLLVCIEPEISRMSLATCSLLRQSRSHMDLQTNLPWLCRTQKNVLWEILGKFQEVTTSF